MPCDYAVVCIYKYGVCEAKLFDAFSYLPNLFCAVRSTVPVVRLQVLCGYLFDLHIVLGWEICGLPMWAGVRNPLWRLALLTKRFTGNILCR
jgi:hypothetical protein